MPGTNAGTGQPISFMCHRQRMRKDWRTGWVPSGHEVVRTGREREVGRGGVRMDAVAREYRCSCGHTGWSKHKDLLHYPIEEDRP